MEFLDTNGILAKEVEMIKSKSNQLLILSPYIKLSKKFIELLTNKDEKIYKKKEIIIICGKKQLSKDVYKKIQGIKTNSPNTIELYFCQKLHAKIFLTQTDALASSLNLLESSESNYEAGIYFTNKETEEFQKINIFCKKVKEDSVAHWKQLQLSHDENEKWIPHWI